MSIVRLALILAITTCASQLARGQFNFKGTVNFQQLIGCGFSADGRYLVTGGDSVRVFHAASGELLQQLRPTLRPRNLTPRSIPRRQFLSEFGKNLWTLQIVFSPVLQDVFATAGDDGVVRVWRVSEREPIHTLKGHKGRVGALAFSPNGRLLASSGSQQGRRGNIDQIRLWDVVSGELVKSDDFFNDGVDSITFLDDETVVFTRNDNKLKRDSVIEFFEISNWTLKRSIRFTPGVAFDVLFTPDRNKMIIAGGECVPLGGNNCRPTGYLWIVDVLGDGPAERVKTKPHGYFNSLAMVGSDRFTTKTSIVKQSRVPTIREMRSVADGKVRSSIDCGTVAAWEHAVSPDGQHLVYCNADQIVFLDAETGQQTRTIVVDQ